MNRQDRREPGSPVTARAVTLGLLAGFLVDLFEAYNDDYLGNTLLIGNHFPPISIVAMMVLIFGVNAGACRWFRVRGFSAGELVLIWGMIGVAGGISGSGLMRYMAPWLAVPRYYANAANEWDVFILKHLPDWMILGKGPNDDAVRWFMEGLPQGRHIPWGPWIVPLAAWIGFTVLLYAANFAFVSIFYRQWAVRERLLFPVVQLPLLIAEEPEPGRRMNPFFRNPLMWAGFAFPAFIWGVNGLGTYFPGLPRIPTGFGVPQLFPDRPWSDFQIGGLSLWFAVTGITFMLASETSLSLWGFYILFRLSYVYIAWLGARATGFWGDWEVKVKTYDTAGATIAIALFLFWTARGFLKDWWKRAVAGRCDPDQDPMPPRLALGLVVLGVGGMTGWFVAGGTQWWAAIACVAMFLAILLVITRIIAEAGLIFVQVTTIPYDLIAGIVPPAWLGGASLNAMNMQRAILMNDIREALMPYVMNGVDAAARTRMHLGKVLAVLALAAAVGLGVSAWSRITTGYKYGAVNMDAWSAVWSPPEYLGGVAGQMKSPPDYEYLGPSDRHWLPVNVAHLLTGGLAAGVMLVLRAKFLWWPLHPFGLVVCTSWAIDGIWFPIFLGWLAKWSIMTFGGASAYRKVLPFFLGMVLGESIVLAFWCVLGLATGSTSAPLLRG